MKRIRGLYDVFDLRWELDQAFTAAFLWSALTIKPQSISNEIDPRHRNHPTKDSRTARSTFFEVHSSQTCWFTNGHIPKFMTALSVKSHGQTALFRLHYLDCAINANPLKCLCRKRLSNSPSSSNYRPILFIEIPREK